MEKLSADGTISEDELVDLIRNLNAQTAGMIEIYVTPTRLVENNIPAVFFTSGITMKTNKTTDDAQSLDYEIIRRRTVLIYHWLETLL